MRWISAFYFMPAFLTNVCNCLVPPKNMGHIRVSIGLLFFALILLFIPMVHLLTVTQREWRVFADGLAADP